MSSETPYALIVEDDAQVRTLLCRILASEGFEVSAVANCPDAKQIVKGHKPDLVVLDLGLPGCDGMELGKWLRGNSPSSGIIILTGRSGLGDRVAGLKDCADDYVTKPFDIDELRARIHSLMRRLPAVSRSSEKQGPEIRFEGWLLRADNCALTSDGQEVKLSVMEFRLLEALAQRPGKIATRGWLLDQMDADVDVSERTVDYHVCTLRIKLRKAGLREDVIASVRGIGYKYSLDTSMTPTKSPDVTTKSGSA